MNVTVTDALLPLVVSPIVQIDARSCGLRGEVPPLGELVRMGLVKFGVDDAAGQKTLGSAFLQIHKTLQGIDLSGNNITALEELPAGMQVRLQQNGQPLVLAPAALQQAVRQQTFLDLSGTALANKEDMKQAA